MGIKGILDLQPKAISLKDYTFDDKHINKERLHNVTREEAVSFMENAKYSLTKWNGRFINYYSYDGAVFIDVENKIIRTSFKVDEFDPSTKKFIERLWDFE